MTKNFTAAIAILAALGLTACAGSTTPVNTAATTITNAVISTTNTVAPLTNTKTQAVINQIINGTKLVCGFAPASLSVAALISANSGVSAASGIVSDICNSVTSAKSSLHRKHKYGSGQTVVVNVDGVVVHGYFVK